MIKQLAQMADNYLYVLKDSKKITDY